MTATPPLTITAPTPTAPTPTAPTPTAPICRVATLVAEWREISRHSPVEVATHRVRVGVPPR